MILAKSRANVEIDMKLQSVGLLNSTGDLTDVET